MKDYYKHMSPEKINFISQFKKFLDKYGREPTQIEINNHKLFEGYELYWVQRNIARLKTIKRRIQQGIY